MHWARITRHSLTSWPSPLSYTSLLSWSSQSSPKGDTWRSWALLFPKGSQREGRGDSHPITWECSVWWALTHKVEGYFSVRPPQHDHNPGFTLHTSVDPPAFPFFLLQTCNPVWAQLCFCQPQSWWLENTNRNENCGFECLQAGKSTGSRCFPTLTKNVSIMLEWQAEVPPIRATS